MKILKVVSFNYQGRLINYYCLKVLKINFQVKVVIKYFLQDSYFAS